MTLREERKRWAKIKWLRARKERGGNDYRRNPTRLENATPGKPGGRHSASGDAATKT